MKNRRKRKIEIGQRWYVETVQDPDSYWNVTIINKIENQWIGFKELSEPEKFIELHRFIIFNDYGIEVPGDDNYSFELIKKIKDGDF